MSKLLKKLRFEDFSESESGWILRHILKQSEPNEDKHLEIVFGVAPCLLALMQSRRKPSRLFMKNSEGPQRDTVLRIQRVSKQTLDKMCGGKVHQGLCLQASPLGFITEEKPITSHEVKNHRALWLVLDGVQDLMNLGAILRSAYFLGVDRIASSIHNRWIKPLVMEVFGYGNLKDMIKVKAEEGWQVVGTVGLEECSPEFTVMPCSDFKMSRPTLLLMGGEGDGLSPELRQINLHPGVESLTVSVATGMFI
uniref:rRNA methyltransferase 1, mitochondrial n=1 Tax=Sinocyclocheilus anshuiensis TaxID=1608454 RepID=A0A671PD76_9TELE